MINKLILGTVQLGLDYGVNNSSGKPDVKQAFDILNTAFDNGIRLLDTAEAYGNSQEIIGLFHNEYPNKIFNIISKINPTLLNKNFNLKQQVTSNLNLLNIESLYAYMFHHYQSLKDNEHIYKELIQLKKVGIIKKIGVSLYTNQELEDIITNYDFDIIQLPFNLFDNASQRKKILLEAKKHNIEIHVRSVFLQGLFFIKPEALPQNLISFTEPIKTINAISNNTQIAINSLALKYVLEKKYIDKVLIGVDSSKQLLENLTVIQQNKKIPHQEIDAIAAIQKELLNPANWK